MQSNLSKNKNDQVQLAIKERSNVTFEVDTFADCVGKYNLSFSFKLSLKRENK